jgi:hypothetical protein
VFNKISKTPHNPFVHIYHRPGQAEVEAQVFESTLVGVRRRNKNKVNSRKLFGKMKSNRNFA